MTMNNLSITFAEDNGSGRRCGGCTLCCKVLPQAELEKPANTRCQHQRTGKGCAIYERRPFSCRFWNCAWLGRAEGTEKLSRPDRAGYVIDIVPDYVHLRNDATGETVSIPVVQVWLDPTRPDAHRDPALRDWLAMRARKDGYAALIRRSSSDGFAIFPPGVSSDGQWHEMGSDIVGAQHSLADIVAVIGGAA